MNLCWRYPNENAGAGKSSNKSALHVELPIKGLL